MMMEAMAAGLPQQRVLALGIHRLQADRAARILGHRWHLERAIHGHLHLPRGRPAPCFSRSGPSGNRGIRLLCTCVPSRRVDPSSGPTVLHCRFRGFRVLALSNAFLISVYIHFVSVIIQCPTKHNVAPCAAHHVAAHRQQCQGLVRKNSSPKISSTSTAAIVSPAPAPPCRCC